MNLFEDEKKSWSDEKLAQLEKQFKKELLLTVQDRRKNKLKIEAHYLFINQTAAAPKKAIGIIPGWGMSCHAFKNFAQLLALESGLPVVLISLPGTGDSDNPPADWARDKHFHNEATIAFRAMAQVMKKEGLEDVGYVLVGHSMGGFVAAEIAAKNSKNIIDLVLIHSAGVKNEPPINLVIRYSTHALANEPAERIKKAIKSSLAKDSSADWLDEIRRQKELVNVMGKSFWGSERLRLHLEKELNVLAAGGIKELVKKFTGNLLVISGTKDQLFPSSQAEELIEAAKKAKTRIQVIVEGGGHGDVMLWPEVYVKEISEYLKNVE